MSIAKKKHGKSIVAVALLTASMAVAASPWGDKGGWSDDEDKPAKHHGMMMEWDKDGDWGKGAMQDEGHMTMRMRLVWNLDLSDGQRKKIRELQRELRPKAFALDDKIEDTSDQLFKLYREEKRDPKAIGKVYDEIFKYRREKIELLIDYGNQVEAVLTDAQRQQIKKFRMNPRWGTM